MISVHLQAIFVAIVTDHLSQAFATIILSVSCCFAFKTLCGTFISFSFWLKYSDFSTDIVQTSIGCHVE